MWRLHAPTFNKWHKKQKKKKKKALQILTHDTMQRYGLTSLVVCTNDKIHDIKERKMTIRKEIWPIRSLGFRDIREWVTLWGLILRSLGCTFQWIVLLLVSVKKRCKGLISLINLSFCYVSPRDKAVECSNLIWLRMCSESEQGIFLNYLWMINMVLFLFLLFVFLLFYCFCILEHMRHFTTGLASILSSREIISRPRIEPPPSPFGLGNLSTRALHFVPMVAHLVCMGAQCRPNGRPWAQNVGLCSKAKGIDCVLYIQIHP